MNKLTKLCIKRHRRLGSQPSATETFLLACFLICVHPEGRGSVRFLTPYLLDAAKSVIINGTCNCVIIASGPCEDKAFRAKRKARSQYYIFVWIV